MNNINFITIKSDNVKRFTLIELLVVIMIISVLASLLAPTLSRALASAKQLSCTNNLKQISIGMHLYVDDYSGWLPPACGTGFVTYYINNYLSQPYYKAVGVTPSSQGSFKSLLFTDMSSLYFCPSLINPSESPFFSGTTPVTEFYSSYHTTSSISGDPNGGCWVISISSWTDYLRKLTRIKGNCVLVLDRNYATNTPARGLPWSYTSYWQYSPTYPWYAPSFHHVSNQCNFLFKDGHVSTYGYTGERIFDKNFIPIN